MNERVEANSTLKEKKDIFIPREQWEEYDLTKSIEKILFPKKINEWFYHGFWPLFMAVFFGDEEPSLPKKMDLSLWPRVYVWDRLSERNDGKANDWKKVGSNPRKRLGVLEVRDSHYYKNWGDTTKNLRNRWLKLNGTVFEIIDVQREDFFAEYKKSFTYKKVGSDIAKRVMNGARKRDEAETLILHFLLVRKIDTGEIKAGIAYELSTMSTNTHYSVGFLKYKDERDPVMTGLLMEWVERESNNGYTYFNFGTFWKEGEPKAWKGYSQFKMKYGVKIVDLPQSLVKVRWG